jgi:hypothetical protein
MTGGGRLPFREPVPGMTFPELLRDPLQYAYLSGEGDSMKDIKRYE